jgi:hypothetical protein
MKRKGTEVNDEKQRMTHGLVPVAAILFLISSTTYAGGVTPTVKGTYRLEGRGSSATCFVVKVKESKPLALVTAAHVLIGVKDDFAAVVLRRWDEGLAEYVRESRNVTIRTGDKPLWKQHPEHDVAVLELPKFDVPVDAILVETLATADDFGQVEVGHLIRSIGYPHAAQFDPSEPGFPSVRLGCVASFPINPYKKHPTFLVDYNTFEGDSGGPVVVEHNGSVRIVGLIGGQHLINEKYKLTYQEGHIRKRLGFAIVVNAQAITETLNREE